MSGSDSAAVRSFPGDQKAYLLAQWGYTQVIGNFRIRSPRLHDNVQGIRIRTAATQADPAIWGGHALQPLYSQDTLIMEVNAPTDAAGNLEYGAALIYYPSLNGVAANLISPDQLKKLAQHRIGQDVPVTTGAGGGYTGQVAINSSVDNFQANLWYAIEGVVVDTKCAAVRIQGVDIGNLGVLIPGAVATPELTGRWFVALSEKYGLPLIPCFNSANKAGILIAVAQDQAAAAVNVTINMVLLGPTITPGQ
jgi:hypothetical protein